MGSKKGILERLREGVVVGDGGFCLALEKRGYVAAGPWTPEATVEHPEAVRQLHREFLRAGADVMQSFTFYASGDNLEARHKGQKMKVSGKDINDAGCKIAIGVAKEGGALVSASLSQTPSYGLGHGKKAVQQEFRDQLDIFINNGVDFLICEYFMNIEEIEWAIEVAKETGKPVASTMCIGPDGDLKGVSTGECGVRMAKAGADIVGINCNFDPETCLESMKLIISALEKEKLKPYLMVQPVIYKAPESVHCPLGYLTLPEFPHALEPRVCTRWDIQQYARKAYEMGIHYIGGCCGFEPYHIRAIAEELSKERGKLPEASEKHGLWGATLERHFLPFVRKRANKEYWSNLKPSSGRPYSASFATPESEVGEYKPY